MQNPRLAGRYAKSLVDLSIERNELEAVYNEMKYLGQVIKSSREFAAVLSSPVIPADKKSAIFDAVTKGNVGELPSRFFKLLLQKGRELNLGEIVFAFIEQYNLLKGIHKVKLTTAVGVSDEVKDAIVAKIKRDTSLQNIELEAKINEELIGGFVLEYNNNLVDASIARDLRDVKAQFAKNIFINQIR
ncbi:MAG: synthase delta chain [Segetibacter sp.]|nr:synthase delta chain [Segetibacter sp.]